MIKGTSTPVSRKGISPARDTPEDRSRVFALRVKDETVRNGPNGDEYYQKHHDDGDIASVCKLPGQRIRSHSGESECGKQQRLTCTHGDAVMYCDIGEAPVVGT